MSGTADDPLPPARGATLAHITLAARDVPATAGFLGRVFGWKPIDAPSNTPVDACWMDIGNGQQVHILRCDAFEASPFEREFGRHLAFFVAAEEMEPFKARLAVEAIAIIAPRRQTPFDRFFFEDANGYLFEVIDRDGWRRES